MIDLKNKIAIVTGGSSGIGQTVAERIAASGAVVVVTYLTEPDGANETVRRIEAAGSRAKAVRCDVSQIADLKDLFDACEAAFGKPDLLVHDAGKSAMTLLKDVTEEEYETIFATNAKSTIFVLKEAAGRLNDGGRIVCVSSSTTAFPVEGTVVYASSKAAIKMTVQVAARELGTRGITVNAILPGVTLSPMGQRLPQDFKDNVAKGTPSGRIGEPGDVADAILLLLAPEAHWITGNLVLANGGGQA